MNTKLVFDTINGPVFCTLTGVTDNSMTFTEVDTCKVFTYDEDYDYIRPLWNNAIRSFTYMKSDLKNHRFRKFKEYEEHIRRR